MKLRQLYISTTLIIFLILFNISYFSNSGLLIGGLSKSLKINYLNAKNYSSDLNNNISLSCFRMEQFMSNENAREIINRVKSHKSKWLRRNAAMSTLGTASYLDGSNSNQYQLLSKESNKFMIENYSDLLQNVLNYFRSKTTANVEYRKNAALPGFHIFDCNQLFSLPVASVHKDMQYLRLKYDNNENIDTENTLSFTLALELPKSGGGLYTFDSPNYGVLGLIIPRPIVYSFCNKEKIDYKTGYMVTHNGQTYHMIAPCKQSKSKYRITLQGHGIYEKNSNTWYLYW